jgi:hypothetical protein
MRTINVRQLVRDFKKEISDLPVAVTRNNQPFIIIQPDKRIEIPREMSDKPEEKEEKVSDKEPDVVTLGEPEEHSGFWCQYPFCTKRGVKQISGTWFCEDHS